MLKSRKLAVAGLFSVMLVLPGCIAATAISVASETVQAGVGVTGAVVGTAVDKVTTSKEERKRDREG
ncbi:hypothetical protein [Ponticaulis profundi]|uniref:Lipoprotein n=1 Tax=Ponticaulis profundi TaxID=2665222 RepID=A0ABW1S717_9PROT